MPIEVTESVGESFDRDHLRRARDLTLAVIEEAARLARPGMSEAELKTLVIDIQKKHGAPQAWHPPQIRVGENSLYSFGRKGLDNPVLNENDIFFIDIGPVFDGHEGDVGRSYALGTDPEMHRCVRDVEALWFKVRDHWRNTGNTGAKLYAFATGEAQSLGWQLTLEKANGHRIADFPHAAKFRGSIEAWDKPLTPDRWILEIQIRHPERAFGAFYEDLLN